ncbi:hypothetical protein MSAN_00823600 [Mycena sanguinolenta]|uniref:Uncharacterized protein n=1 Tax=Mycena sanguinolenta TaxID=230812 RepID=A0A8H7DD00_9AGAR|nr:hypothetical protein MSAN_00823600 [Mycena sanguinolenta]
MNRDLRRRVRVQNQNRSGGNIHGRLVGHLLLSYAKHYCSSFHGGLFGAVRSRGYISSSVKLADAVQNHPQSVTYVVTFLSTVLSAFSSYLFSQAILRMIAVFLSNPMTISDLRFGISVSRRSVLLDFDNKKGLLVTAVFFVATLGQTASWSSLFTLDNIAVYTPLEGIDFDFTSEAFLSQLPNYLTYAQGGVWYIDSALLSVVATSGTTSAMARIGYPTILDYFDHAYVNTTGGIFATDFQRDSPVRNSSRFITYNTEPFPRTSSSFNFTMSQQGLTAAVSCRNMTGQLSATSDPPFQRIAKPAEIVIDNVVPKTSYTAFSFMTTCTGNITDTETYLSSTNNTIIALACPDDASLVGNITITIDTQGDLYSDINGTMICHVTPQIQNVTAQYYNGSFISTQPDPAYAPINSLMDIRAFTMATVNSIIFGQGTMRNTLGDAMASILTDQFPGEDVDYITLWEAYFRGIIEFAGTALKNDLWESFGPLHGYVPLNMTRPIHGTATTITVGWQYKGWESFAVLLPSTCISIASILIVLFTQYRSRGVPVQHMEIDPSNPMVLMAAASAGGMGDTFDGLTKEEVEEGLGKKVKLARVGGKVGFVQVNNMPTA